MWIVYKTGPAPKHDYINIYETDGRLTPRILFDLAKMHNIPVHWLNAKLITSDGFKCWYYVDVCGCFYA